MSKWEHFLIYMYVYIPNVVRLRISKYTKCTKMADISSTFINKETRCIKKITRALHARILHVHYRLAGRRLTEAHKQQLAMDRAGRRQHLASQTAKEWQECLDHGEELVECGGLHRRLLNSESPRRRGRRRANARKVS